MLNRWLEAVVDRMIPVGVFLAALAPIILTIEVAEWLAYGEWPGWTVEDGLLFAGIEKPLAHFQATQFLLDLATDLPLAVGLYLVGIAVFLGAFKISPVEQ
ncbi:MAG TPA: hypothetical protein VGR19_00900 [Allosphingosinicella sp.]|nr:hypothetical protein [Allosphingosinicella sp.]